MRLVLAADADRRDLERELHDGLQQRLVALAVELQLVDAAVDSDPARVRELLQEMECDLRHALDEAARLADEIHPSILAPRDLAAAVRSTAAIAGIPVRVRVELEVRHPPELLASVHQCFREVLLRSGAGELTVTVRDDASGVAFEILGKRARPDVALDRLRDRVEALKGSLAIEWPSGAGIRVAGSLPSIHGYPLSER